MDYRDIEVFLEISKTHNITKAAENLFLSQSSVSHRLKRLEQELGAQLVARQRGMRSLEFTPRGEAFVPLAKRWMEIYRETEICMNGPEMTLSIGAIQSVNPGFLYPLLNKIIHEEHELNIYLSQMSSVDLYKALENQQIDIGFVGYRYHRPHVNVRPILRQKLCVISRSPNFPVDQAVHPSSLDPKLEIFSYWGPEYQAWHDRWWSPAVRPCVVTDSMSNISLLLSKDDYWSIVPLNLATDLVQMTNLKIYQLEDPPPERICYMITHQFPKVGHKQAIKLFNQILVQMEEEHQELAFQE